MDSMTFSTSSSTSSDDYSSVEVCEKHQLVLSVICNDHEVVVCNRCCWVEHRDCQVILIEDAADTHRDEIKQHKKKLKKKSELIRRICEDRTSSSRGLRSSRELADVRQKFEEFCQRVSEQLDEMKIDIIQNMEIYEKIRSKSTACDALVEKMDFFQLDNGVSSLRVAQDLQPIKKR